jgi:hypothetical protein
VLTGSVAHNVTDAYRKYLFGTKTLQDPSRHAAIRIQCHERLLRPHRRHRHR